MNKRQKAALLNIILVVTLTAIAVVAMVNFKDWVNHTEAMRAMDHLGRVALKYRQDYHAVPPESHIDNIRKNLQGHARLGELYYRARWIDFESSDDEILACTEKSYHSFFLGSGAIVLRLDGRVEWMDTKQFRALLAKQQSPSEIELFRE